MRRKRLKPADKRIWIPSWGTSDSIWNYTPDAEGLGWNSPLPARCFGDWVLSEPANEIEIEWRNILNTGAGDDKGQEVNPVITTTTYTYTSWTTRDDLFTNAGLTALTLPTAVNNTTSKKTIRVHNFTGGTITVSTAVGDTFDGGGTTVDILNGDSLGFLDLHDGTDDIVREAAPYGQWRIASRADVFSGVMSVGDLYPAKRDIEEAALAVADTTLLLPVVRFRQASEPFITYTSASPAAGRHLLVKGTADSNGEPLTHIQAVTAGTPAVYMNCGPGGGIYYEMRNIRLGAWAEDIALDPEAQWGGSIYLSGESGMWVGRNLRLINCGGGLDGFASVVHHVDEFAYKKYTAYLLTDSHVRYCGTNALKHNWYNVSFGPWIMIRVTSTQCLGHRGRHASDGMLLNCSLGGRDDDTMAPGVGYQTAYNLMTSKRFHAENLAGFPSIGNVSGLNSRAMVQFATRRDSADQAFPSSDADMSLFTYETGVDNSYRYSKWNYSGTRWWATDEDLGSEHSMGGLSVDTVLASTTVQLTRFDPAAAGPLAPYRVLSTDTATDAWEVIFFDKATGDSETKLATFASTAGFVSTFTLASVLARVYPSVSTYIAIRRTAAHPLGEQRWDTMELNEIACNPWHPSYPYHDAALLPGTPTGQWSDLDWPKAMDSSFRNVYCRPLHVGLAGQGCVFEDFASISHTYAGIAADHKRLPFPPLASPAAQANSWPRPPAGKTAGAFTELGWNITADFNDSVYGTDGAGGNGIRGSDVRNPNRWQISNVTLFEDAGHDWPMGGQLRVSTSGKETEVWSAQWWMDSSGVPQRVLYPGGDNSVVSPMPATSQTYVNGAITGSTAAPVKQITLTDATAAIVGRKISIEMEGANFGYGVLFDTIEAVAGNVVTLRLGATHDIAHNARVGIIVAASDAHVPGWVTAARLWRRFRETRMV